MVPLADLPLWGGETGQSHLAPFMPPSSQATELMSAGGIHALGGVANDIYDLRFARGFVEFIGADRRCR